MWNLFERGVTGEGLVGRQCAWQYPEEKAMVFRTQLIVGLWWWSQGFPMIRFQPASLVTWKVNSSICWSIASFKIQVCVICPTIERASSAGTKSSGFSFGVKGKFKFRAKSRSINWELAPESTMQVPGKSSFMKQDKVSGSSDPKSPDTNTDEILNARDKAIRRRALWRDFCEIPTKTLPVPSITTSSKTAKQEGTEKETGTRLMAPGCILVLRSRPSLAMECTSFLPLHRVACHW